MSLSREILGTSVVVLAAILRCFLPEELGWAPSRITLVTMAVAQVLALARNFALVRVRNCGTRDGGKKCKHQEPNELSRPAVQTCLRCAPVLAAVRQLRVAAGRANTWACNGLAAQGPALLVCSCMLLGTSGIRLLCMVFGQPSLRLCCIILWPLAMLVGGAVNTMSRAVRGEPLLPSNCPCATQGGHCCRTPEDCPYNSEFWDSASCGAAPDAPDDTQ